MMIMPYSCYGQAYANYKQKACCGTPSSEESSLLMICLPDERALFLWNTIEQRTVGLIGSGILSSWRVRAMSKADEDFVDG